LLTARDLELKCIRAYSKYSDSVAICCAVYNLLIKNPHIAKFIGIEHNLKNTIGHVVTPDIVAAYDNDKKGLLFELKWSLPLDEKLLEKEIEELEKYFVPCLRWGKTSGDQWTQDLVLICHIDDVQRTTDMIKHRLTRKNQSPLGKEGFAVWSWSITPPKQGGGRKEEMRLFPVYGKTRNRKIEELIGQPGGILFPEEVLTYLRFTFTFIKEKPPLQYTMTVLIQNILSSFQSSPEKESHDIHVDMIYERAKAFFPSWHSYDAETVQVKRKWIREALETLCELNLCGKVLNKDDWWKIPIPLIRTRKPIQEVLCKKAAKAYLKQMKTKKTGRPRTRVSRPKATGKDKSIAEYL
jgi:hypothetical protein